MREIFLLKTRLINISVLRKILLLIKKALVLLVKKLQIFLPASSASTYQTSQLHILTIVIKHL